ncbi:MAG: TonB-dependent receptor [Bacteroidales bacterium]|nr:TonB-dependent receptor [Bacteroidales bacterium]
MSIVLYRIVKFIVHRPQCSVATLLYVLCSWAFLSSATAQDTIQILDEVEVSSQRTPATLRTAAPTQVLEAAAIEAQGLLQLSDAVRQMAGVTLKDYGGVGGMKTVSARGLGSQFSTVTIDGVAVDNAQNGQVDLGRYLLGNAAYVSFSQGQQQEPLLSARAYAAGNVLNIETSEPQFFLAERTNLKVGMELGSFGMMNPTALWEQKWSRRLKSSVWVNWLKSDGDYPFTLYHTYDHTGLTTHERRLHSAMHMFTADGNLFYSIAPKNTLTAKVHYMRGMHQLPGQVVLNSSYTSAQSTHEHSAFTQVRWRVEKERWQWQLLGKAMSGYDQYEDSLALGYVNNYMENHYRQREGYISASALWHALPWFELSMAADGDMSNLRSNLAYRNDVLRSSLLTVLSARAHAGPLEGRAHLLATATRDRVGDLDTCPAYRRLSPYAAVLYTPITGLTLRYFYKETYRVPNFSELYFFLSIPRNLRPERAHQHNIGVTYATDHLNATVDGYFNRVEDKIIAKPGSNMYYWTMENLGLVHILGVDATANFQFSTFICQINYSFAHAVDMSDPTDEKTYGYQIRYTPRHSGGGSLRWESRWVNLGATAMVVGHRYAYAQNNANNRLPAYCDLGLSADRRFDLRWGTLRVQVQVLNLLDTQYEVVQYYPMMGRNYRLAVTYEF